jgi:hypothetical protein
MGLYILFRTFHGIVLNCLRTGTTFPFTWVGVGGWVASEIPLATYVFRQLTIQVLAMHNIS